ncbi:phage protease [Desulfovulcanus sp.]
MKKESRSFILSLNAIQSGDRIKVLPLGEIKGRDGRYWELTEDDAVQIVELIKKNGIDLVLDWDHGTYDYPADGRAAGWFKADSFAVEPEGPDGPGIYAVLEFTPSGQESVLDKKEYRYFSPVFWSQGTRILELESFGLTNIPNITDLPALNSKKNETQSSQGGQSMDREMEINRLRQEKEALEQEKNRLQKERDEALLQLNKLQGELESLKKKEQEREINEMVEKAILDGKLAPAQKETALKLGLNSKELLEELINSSPYDFRQLKDEAKGGDENKSALSDTTLQICKMLGVKPEAVQKEVKDGPDNR